jgi:hypothetical protein
MIDADQAKDLVLRLRDASSGRSDRLAIQYCALSGRGDYWIVCANSEDFVIRGVRERVLVGVNAHLVNTMSGEIETVANDRSVEQYLEDKYDLAAAGINHYVLVPCFDKNDKAGVIRLRQKLGCSPNAHSS